MSISMIYPSDSVQIVFIMIEILKATNKLNILILLVFPYEVKDPHYRDVVQWSKFSADLG